MRIVFPVDILSYALGLFSRMRTKSYMLATIIGITPFAFAWTYLGEIPYQYQAVILIIATLILIIGYFIKQKFKEIKGRKEGES